MKMLPNVLRTVSRKPVTRRYPKVKRAPFPGARGQLDMDPDKCTYCMLCAKRCPTGALAVTRKPDKTWTLDPHRCILCNYCVEVCPAECLFMRPEHRAPTV